jgi:cytochrome c553
VIRKLCLVLLLALLPWLAHAADPSHGATIYQSICSVCHGPDPRQNVNGIRLAANNPALIQLQFSTNPDMRFLAAVLSPTDVADVAAYINAAVNGTTGTPSLGTSQPWLMFPAQTVNTSNPGLQLTLTNPGTANLSITGLTTSPPDFGLSPAAADWWRPAVPARSPSPSPPRPPASSTASSR